MREREKERGGVCKREGENERLLLNKIGDKETERETNREGKRGT
jgi:hypothetical protein